MFFYIFTDLLIIHETIFLYIGYSGRTIAYEFNLVGCVLSLPEQIQVFMLRSMGIEGRKEGKEGRKQMRKL